MVQDLSTLDVSTLTPLTPEVISRQVLLFYHPQNLHMHV